MEIKNSLDWQTTREKLNATVLKLPYDQSVRQMIRNIDLMVTELSKLEVTARRTKVTHYADAQVAKINEAITNIEKIIMIAILYS